MRLCNVAERHSIEYRLIKTSCGKACAHTGKPAARRQSFLPAVLAALQREETVGLDKELPLRPAAQPEIARPRVGQVPHGCVHIDAGVRHVVGRAGGARGYT